MELRHLRYFLALAHHLHFGRAARSLHISQPSLSQQIKALEEKLGVKLFERSRRRVVLTSDGEVLLSYARQLVALADDAQREFAERNRLRIGRVRLGTTPTLGGHLLPSVVRRFFDQYPGVELTITEDGTDELARRLGDGRIDLALLSEDVRLGGNAFEALMEERIVVAVPAGHPAADRTDVRLIDLKDERFILCREGYHLRTLTLDACAASGFSPRVSVSGTDVDTALRFVRARLGVTLVPEIAVRAMDGVAGVTLAEPRLTRTVGIAWNPNRYLSRAAAAFRRFLRETLKPDRNIHAGPAQLPGESR